MPPEARDALARLRALLLEPRPLSLDAIERLRATLPPATTPEAWNTAFGEGSLFDAWTRSPLVQGLYAANAQLLRSLLDARPDPVLIEVGAGDGRMWSQVFRPDDRATLLVIDPHPDPHEQILRRLPEGVRLRSLRRGVEAARLPDADAIVCSLTLHHLAGTDAGSRSRAGLGGPGKHEILARFARALSPRCGVLLLNEADVDCEIDLLPGDPYLRAQIADSYIRRCAAALAEAIEREPDPDLAWRWWTIIHRWCLDQLDVADVPLADRDVYELTVPRWLHLLRAAGLHILDHRFTDEVELFHRYVAVPAQAWRAHAGDVPGLPTPQGHPPQGHR